MASYGNPSNLSRPVEDIAEGKTAMQDTKVKPGFDEVYKYARKYVDVFIRKFAAHLPFEQKEEIAQNAMIRVWEAYKKLEADKGWKSFIQMHCRGSVLDFLKAGDGFIEDGAAADPENDGLKTRVEITSEKDDGAILSVEETAAFFGIYELSQIESGIFNPNWPLLARMCGVDENLHIVCKVILGYSQEEIAEQIGTDLGTTLSRERISQRIYEFFEKLDDPELVNDPWTNQCIFAIGLCDYYHMPNECNGQGWDREPFDLNDSQSFKNARRHYRPTLFDALVGQMSSTIH